MLYKAIGCISWGRSSKNIFDLLPIKSFIKRLKNFGYRQRIQNKNKVMRVAKITTHTKEIAVANPVRLVFDKNLVFVRAVYSLVRNNFRIVVPGMPIDL